jgi:hypothetical protein
MTRSGTMKTKSSWIRVLGLSVLVGAPLQLVSRGAIASDYADSPTTALDPAADIADFYAWPTDHGTIVAILTFAAYRAPGAHPVYDASKLYTIHIDNTSDPDGNPVFDDNTSDIRIQVRFAQNHLAQWGVQFANVPGAEHDTFDGPVQTTLTNGTATAIAGNFDDPFFFDFQGFLDTRANLLDDASPNDLAFAQLTDGTPVDYFAGTNAMAIVVEFDADEAVGANPDSYLQLWATTGVTP